MSAILLPYLESGAVDWDGFENHVTRTLNAGLSPAVNMDTGYAHLIDETTRVEVLKRTQKLANGRRYVAGAFVGDHPGDAFAGDAYNQQIDSIQDHAGVPVIFQSFGLTGHGNTAILNAYEHIAKRAKQFIAFELGQMFASFGHIYELEVYEQLIQIDQCIGAKHSSLSRVLEWERLKIRDRVREDFMVMTGNDLAIDMVQWGSDYLLGLSTFAPDLFAKRDAMWAEGDNGFYELNDLLQYLGFFAFRDPVPAYKHSAAQFLKLEGFIATNQTHPNSTTRPESDIEVLDNIRQRLHAWR